MLGRIYILEGGGKFYIGSTTSTMKERMKKHRSKSNETIATNRLVYVHFKEIGWSNVTYNILFEIEVTTRRELLEKECEIIKQYKNDTTCLNKSLPLITAEDKKLRDRRYGKQRRLNNPENERLRVKNWRKNNPDKWKAQYTRRNNKSKQDVDNS